MGTAYQAADERGHHEIKELLLKSDARAAHYGGAHESKTRDRQQIQRMVFKTAVKASSMDTINNLVSQYEKFCEREIKKGNTLFLRELSKFGQDGFQDVIKLATRPRESSHTQKKGIDSSGRSQLRKFLSHINCMRLKDREVEATSLRVPHNFAPFRLLRAATAFIQDPLGEHFPQVLDQMTQAAVKVLESAIENKDTTITQQIAHAWVEALDNLISYPKFGQPMLDQVPQKRVDQLKEYLTKRESNQEDPGDSEAMVKATALASVGIELLLAAVKRGPKSKPLSSVTSKLWIKALHDIEDLGREGEEPMRVFVQLFTQQFADTINSRDQVNTEISAQAGIELLRATVLHPKTKLFNQFSDEVIFLWRLAYESNMGHMLQDLVNRGAKECKLCLKDAKHDEALGLVLVNIRTLGSAIEHRSDALVSMLQHCVESASQFTREGGYRAVSTEGFRAQDLEAIFSAVIGLLETAEETQPGLLDTPTSNIVDTAEVLSTKGDQTFAIIINQQIEEVAQIVDPLEQEKRSIQIRRVIFLFLEIALCAEERNPAVISTLAAVASGSWGVTVLDVLDRDELARYERAAGYLRAKLR